MTTTMLEKASNRSDISGFGHSGGGGGGGLVRLNPVDLYPSHTLSCSTSLPLLEASSTSSHSIPLLFSEMVLNSIVLENSEFGGRGLLTIWYQSRSVHWDSCHGGVGEAAMQEGAGIGLGKFSSKQRPPTVRWNASMVVAVLVGLGWFMGLDWNAEWISVEAVA